mgnify:CR=1 FL=1
MRVSNNVIWPSSEASPKRVAAGKLGLKVFLDHITIHALEVGN